MTLPQRLVVATLSYLLCYYYQDLWEMSFRNKMIIYIKCGESENFKICVPALSSVIIFNYN
ncbi:hypothetical protein I79_012439 [Cricetulus griseus]|uniref:Uncharacterized protein n=1 Tax=Cricetulus griseus TaxID=10029 RepID=G3HNU5_CRIGR|nr:hypothetical protein I79_012439 [Cricetulus griseus]